MSARYFTPDMLWPAQGDTAERAYMVTFLKRCREELGLTHFVEPCCGPLSLSLVARAVGYQPDEIEASDVGLYSTVIGYLCSGRPLEELEVTVDGALLDRSGMTDVEYGALILWWQLLLRLEAKPEVDYWRELVADVYTRGAEHRKEIARSLTLVSERLAGISYGPLNLWDHLAQTRDNDRAVIVVSPPASKGSFEKFFDTRSRLRWNEPTYEVFDPEAGHFILHGAASVAKALVVQYQYAKPGECVGEPIYARNTTAGENLYLVCNRPEDVFRLTGGPMIVPRSGRNMEPGPWPIIPSDYEFNEAAPVGDAVQVVPLPYTHSAYYRSLWMHRIVSKETGLSFAVLVNGYICGVVGISFDSMSQPLPSARWTDAPIIRYAVGAPHHTVRLTRLATRLALLKTTLRQIATPGVALHAAAAERIVTIVYTKHPESKGLRGLMKRVHREPGKLVYAADLSGDTVGEAYRVWLAGERAYIEKRRRSG